MFSFLKFGREIILAVFDADWNLESLFSCLGFRIDSDPSIRLDVPRKFSIPNLRVGLLLGRHLRNGIRRPQLAILSCSIKFVHPVSRWDCY